MQRCAAAASWVGPTKERRHHKPRGAAATPPALAPRTAPARAAPSSALPSRQAVWRGRLPARSPQARGTTTRLHAAAPTAFSAPLAAPFAPADADTHGELMAEMAAFLAEDLQHLFDERGIDARRYEERMAFEDPLTRYDTLSGYLFNIQMLRRVFAPTFQLHDVKRTGELELTTRWTMGMRLAANPLQALWEPQLCFTGVSVLRVNPGTRKFCSHVDYWDSLPGDKQGYLSLDAVGDLFAQVASLQRTPAELESPQYAVLQRRADFEVRRYDEFLVAQTSMPGARGAAGDGASGFGTLARYIFGGNADKAAMAMTTPVFTTVAPPSSPDESPAVSMAFPIERRWGTDPAALPAPLERTVQRSTVAGAVRAVASFAGIASDADAAAQEARLRAALLRDGLHPRPGFQLARYNDPGTPPWARRNEVLIDLEDAAEDFTAVVRSR